ncbi:hypothetical protein N7G274_001191 [Stereocaulon virgatum]|uniref:Uncharacterized protein n=1 Tax=Stereocaulon virgatum TaxID=373712 RepID=A0ABR4AN54_9LECA
MAGTTTASTKGQSPASSSANNPQTLPARFENLCQDSTTPMKWPHIFPYIRQAWAETKVEMERLEQIKKLEAVSFVARRTASGIDPAGLGYHAREADNLPSQIEESNLYVFPSGQTYIFPPGQTPKELIPDPSKPCLNEDCPLTQANISHNQGPYFHNDEARVREMFGVSNPPPDILEAWRRMFSGKRYSKADEDKVIAFAFFHAWLSDEIFEVSHEIGSWTQYTKDFYEALIDRITASKRTLTFPRKVWIV